MSGELWNSGDFGEFISQDQAAQGTVPDSLPADVSAEDASADHAGADAPEAAQSMIDHANGQDSTALTVAERKPAGTSRATTFTSVVRDHQAKSAERSQLFLDLETIPDFDRQHLFDLPPLPEARPETGEAELMPPADFIGQGLEPIKRYLAEKNPVLGWLEQVEECERKGKDRKGLCDAIESCRKAKGEVAEATSVRLKKMSVTPEMCRIVAMGWAVNNEDPTSLVVGQELADAPGVTVGERYILDTFWSLAARNCTVIGWNVLDFDLIVLLIRSILLDVPSLRIISLHPWNNHDVLDLMRVRYGNRYGGLKSFARMLGIGIPAEGVDGSQVLELFASSQLDRIGEYVRSDVSITRLAHRQMSGYFCP